MCERLKNKEKSCNLSLKKKKQVNLSFFLLVFVQVFRRKKETTTQKSKAMNVAMLVWLFMFVGRQTASAATYPRQESFGNDIPLPTSVQMTGYNSWPATASAAAYPS